jgi:alpha-N-arabinofuranosidase
MMAVNLGTGTPEEARNWLEYCNLEAGTRWPDLRVEHGYADPLDVKLWCLGNEMDGPWQIGHVPAETYAIRAQQTARMMRMVDPDVELVVCGSCAPDLPTYLDWDRTVLTHCGDTVDYISVHRYVGNEDDDTANFLAVTNSIDQQIEEMDTLCKLVHRRLKTPRRAYLSVDEWNIWYRARHGAHLDGRGKFAPHLLEEEYNLEDALVAAGFLNSFIRHADSVKIANLAQIVNVIAPLLTRGNELLRQSIFHALALYAKRRTGQALRVAVDGPSYGSTSYGTVNYLDASAILHGKQLHVFATNRSQEEHMDLSLAVAGATPARVVDAEIVTGSDPKATNTFEQPNQVTRQPFGDVSLVKANAVLAIPPLSVVAATVELG